MITTRNNRMIIECAPNDLYWIALNKHYINADILRNVSMLLSFLKKSKVPYDYKAFYSNLSVFSFTSTRPKTGDVCGLSISFISDNTSSHIGINSRLYPHLTSEQMTFLVAHELAHALFKIGHNKNCYLMKEDGMPKRPSMLAILHTFQKLALKHLTNQ